MANILKNISDELKYYYNLNVFATSCQNFYSAIESEKIEKALRYWRKSKEYGGRLVKLEQSLSGIGYTPYKDNLNSLEKDFVDFLLLKIMEKKY